MKTLGGILCAFAVLVGLVANVGADPYEIGEPILEFDLPDDFVYLGRSSDDGDLFGAVPIDGNDLEVGVVRVDLGSGAVDDLGWNLPAPWGRAAMQEGTGSHAAYRHQPEGCVTYTCSVWIVVDAETGETAELPTTFQPLLWVPSSTGAPQLLGNTITDAGNLDAMVTFSFATGLLTRTAEPDPSYRFAYYGGLDEQVFGIAYPEFELQLRDIETGEVLEVLLDDTRSINRSNLVASPSLEFFAWGDEESVGVLDRSGARLGAGEVRYVARELWPSTSLSTGVEVPQCGYTYVMELEVSDLGEVSGLAGAKPEEMGCGSLSLDEAPTYVGYGIAPIERDGFYFEADVVEGLTLVNRVGVAEVSAAIPPLLRAQSGLSTYHPSAYDGTTTTVSQLYRERSDVGSARLTIFAAELLYALDPDDPDAPASESLTLYPVISERKGDGGEVSFETDPATQHSGGFFRERFFDVTAPTFDGMWVDFDITMYGVSDADTFGLDIGNGAGEPVTVAVNSRTGETAVLVNRIWVAETGTAGDVDGPDGDVAIAIQFTGAAEGDDYTVPASEILGQPEFTGMHADPVETSSGNFTHSEFDLLAPGGAPAVAISRTYNSQDPDGGVFGPGWTSWPDVSLQIDGVDHIVRAPDGRRLRFEDLGGSFTSPQGFPGTLANEGSGFILTLHDGEAWHFDAAGTLLSRTHPDQPTTTFGHSGGELTSIDLGGLYSWTYAWANGRPSVITSSTGETATFTYDAAGHLVAVDAPTGHVGYDIDELGRLLEITDGEGRSVVANTYVDDTGAVATQTMPSGDVITYDYDPSTLTTTVTHSATGETMVYTHSPQRWLESMTDSLGRSGNYEYNPFGFVTAITDRAGTRVEQGRTDDGRLAWVRDAAGRTATFAYDDQGRIVEMVEPDAGTTTWTYDGDSRIPATTVSPNGGTTELVTVGGLVTEVTDADGIVTTVTYNDDRTIASLSNAVGAVTSFEHDAQGRIVRVVSPTGLERSFVHDQAGRVLSERYPDGAEWSYTYDASGRLLTTTDPEGNVTEHRYDAAGRRIETVRPDGESSTYDYNEAGDLVAMTDPSGAVDSYQIGALGRLEGSTDATGVASTNGYDELGRVTSVADGEGRTTTTGYDDDGRVLASTNPLGESYRYSYDEAGRLATSTDPLGQVTTFGYDDSGRLVSVTEPDGATRRRSYSPAGRLLSTTDENGNTTALGYDDAGRLASISLPDGSVITLETDLEGRVSALVSPSGLRTEYTFDEVGRVVGLTDAAGASFGIEFDRNGRPVSLAGPDGSTTSFQYDELSNLSAAADPNGGTTGFAYDLQNSLESVTTTGGAVWSWTHDDAGRLTSVIDPLGQATTILYDAVGRAAASQDASGRTNAVAYDDAGRVVLVSDTLDGATVSTSIERDALGRTTSMTDESGSLAYTYDDRGRVTSVSSPAGDVAYAYDPAGNLTSITYPDGSSATYVWDEMNRLVGVNHGGGDLAFSYDTDGNLLTETLADGSVRTYGYTDGALSSLDDPILGRLDVTLDANGRIVEVGGASSRTYVYDAAGQLVEADVEGESFTYAYDEEGNLASIGGAIERQFAHDAASQLTTATIDGDEVVFTYDESGRRLSEVGTGYERTYAYDERGRLVEVATIENGEPSSGLVAVDDAITAPPGQPVTVDVLANDLVDSVVDVSIIDAAGAPVSVSDGFLQTAAPADGSTLEIRYEITDGTTRSQATVTVTPSIEMCTVIAGDEDTDSDRHHRRHGHGHAHHGSRHLRGTEGDDVICVLDGADANRVSGLGGDDVIFAGASGALIDAGSGDDIVYGSDQRDVILPGSGDDIVFANGGRDQVVDLRGDNVIIGGDGNDHLRTGDGDDVVVGGAGRDTLSVGDGDDFVSGGDDADVVTSRWGDDVLLGGAGNDVLSGGHGDDLLLGGSGIDRLFGWSGDDVLDVGVPGVGELASGGSGSDACSSEARRFRCELTSVEVPASALLRPGIGAEAGEPGDPATSVETVMSRTYDPDGLLSAVDFSVDGEIVDSYTLLWDRMDRVPRVLGWTDGAGDFTAFVYAQGRAAFAVADGATVPFAFDAAGDAVQTVESAGFVVESVTPYGETDGDLTAFGFGADGELITGDLQYSRARDLDPVTGVFLTRDELRGVPGEVVIGTPYHFAKNDPVNTTDPTGMRPEDDDFDYSTPVSLEALRNMAIVGDIEAGDARNYGFLSVASRVEINVGLGGSPNCGPQLQGNGFTPLTLNPNDAGSCGVWVPDCSTAISAWVCEHQNGLTQIFTYTAIAAFTVASLGAGPAFGAAIGAFQAAAIPLARGEEMSFREMAFGLALDGVLGGVGKVLGRAFKARHSFGLLDRVGDLRWWRSADEVFAAGDGYVDDAVELADGYVDDAAEAVNRTDNLVRADDVAGACLLGSNSFVAGTLVLLADGSSVPIEDVGLGDRVWAEDPAAGVVGGFEVVDLITGEGVKHLVEVSAGGVVFTATEGHPFWVDDRGVWVDAGDLVVGDVLRGSDGSAVVVDGLSERVVVGRVHNLTVEGVHTYYVVSGAVDTLTHNTRCWRLSPPAPDTASKGVHFTFDGVELAARPAEGGSVVFRPVFSSTSDGAARSAIRAAEEALAGDSQFRRSLLENARRSLEYLRTNSDLPGAEGRQAEVRFLIQALES